MKKRQSVAALALSAVALVSIALSEGFRDKAYDDGVGVQTIGYGTTQGTRKGDTTTPDKALFRLLNDIYFFETSIKKCVTAPLYQHEYDAYTELTYNVGATAFCTSSIPERLAFSDYAGACKAILDFDKVRDRTKPKIRNKKTGKWEYPLIKVQGLSIRREREYKTCIGE